LRSEIEAPCGYKPLLTIRSIGNWSRVLVARPPNSFL